MQFVAPETGQSLQLIHMDEIRPLRGGHFMPDLALEIARRYRFQTVPAKVDLNQPAKFEMGVVQLSEFTIPIMSLEVYGDGIVFNTRNTDDADLAMDEFVAWTFEYLKLQQPARWLPRRHYSRIIVDLDNSAGDTFVRNFTALKAIVAKAFGYEQSLEATQLTFGPHPAGELPYLNTWLFQPRIGQPYAPNRYFSAAPLSTGAHYDMLCELEAAASKG